VGFLGDIGEFFEDVGNTVIGLIPGAATILKPLGIRTSSGFLPKFVTGVINPLTLIPDPISAAVGTLGVSSLLPKFAGSLVGGLSPPRATIQGRTSLIPQGGPPMANGFFSDIFSSVGDIFGIGGEDGASWGDVLQTGTALATSFFPPQESFGAYPVAQRMPYPVPAPRSPMPIPRGPMGIMSGKFSARYPNLFAVLQSLRMAGQKLTRTKAWSLLRQYGPASLIGLGFTAEAINELMVAGPGRRRMNPANVKALRRGLRRI